MFTLCTGLNTNPQIRYLQNYESVNKQICSLTALNLSQTQDQGCLIHRLAGICKTRNNGIAE